jgi:N-acetylmuramoyl-L-alanine amidase
MSVNNIKYIVIHCTAGFQSAEKVQAYFTRSKEDGGRGWITGGYHRIIETDGTVKKIYPFDRVTNGVRGYNSQCLHISYVGGIELKDGKYLAKDTRTEAQHKGIQEAIMEAIQWLKDNGKDITKDLMILGHRDFSTDRNKNGVIDPNERIKECPSFDAITEYQLFSATNWKQILPSNR